ncbi:MAG: hypothetical protein AB7S92_26000 [Parvibaculaceae bacterium]
MTFRPGLLALAVLLSSGPLLAKPTLPPQITRAIKSWQQCAAAAYKAERQMKADREAAAEASFAACRPQFETVVARAGEHGLAPEDVRAALATSKAALKKQMTAH